MIESSLEYRNFNMVSERGKSEEKISVLAQGFLQETDENQWAVFCLQAEKFILLGTGPVRYGFRIAVRTWAKIFFVRNFFCA